MAFVLESFCTPAVYLSPIFILLHQLLKTVLEQGSNRLLAVSYQLKADNNTMKAVRVKRIKLWLENHKTKCLKTLKPSTELS